MLSIHVLLAHHVVLNHTFELLISINRWNKYVELQTNVSASKHKHT